MRFLPVIGGPWQGRIVEIHSNIPIDLIDPPLAQRAMVDCFGRESVHVHGADIHLEKKTYTPREICLANKIGRIYVWALVHQSFSEADLPRAAAAMFFAHLFAESGSGVLRRGE